MSYQDPSKITSYHNSANFYLIIKALPGIEFYCQNLNIPGISMSPIPYTVYGKKSFPISGDKLDFSPLTVSFFIDEDFENYLSIYNWMIGVCSPSGSEQYVAQKLRNSDFPVEGLYTDISVVTLNKNLKMNKKFIFHNCIPTELSDITFNVETEDTIWSISSVTFNYSDFTIE